MECRVCNSPDTTLVHSNVRDYEHGVGYPVDYVQCPKCATLLQQPFPSAIELAGWYPVDYRPHATTGYFFGREALFLLLKRMQSRILYRSIRRQLPPRTGSVLEIGCGAGLFLRALRRRGFKNLAGMDRAPELRSALEPYGIEFVCHDFEQPWEVDRKFDLIVLNYVLEHALNPQDLLGFCKKHLAPAGRILILTPSSRSWSYSLFGRFWSGLHAPRHTEVFNPNAIQLMATKVGLGKVRLSALTDPGTWAISFQNVLRSTSEAPPTGTAWYSFFLLPLWWPLARLERFVGKSSALVAVLQPSE